MSTHDEMVSKLDRELRLFPVVNDKPKKLSPGQIEFHNKNGYFSPLRAFDDQGVLAKRANFDRILQKFIQAGEEQHLSRFRPKRKLGKRATAQRSGRCGL